MFKRFLQKFSHTLLIILVIVIGLSAFYSYKQSNNINSANISEINNLIKKVSKHALLPNEETPSVATVADPNLLKDQPFFVNTLVGDKVLMYSNEKKAILYRPSIDRVINITVIDLNAPAPASLPQTNATTTSKTSIKKNSN